MAELEITYIPYGLDEISQLDLMASLANGIDSYLGSKNWAKKDKYRQAWLNAYQDIMNRGIIGASNDTGMWRVNHKGADIDMSTKSNIEREMYGDAAYYIQLLMAKMTPRVKEEDKKKDKNKTKFDNREFNLGLTEHVGKAFGGMDPSIWNKRWAELDPEERGIRGTAGRQAKMAELLASFRDKIKADLDKYSFEDTPYGSFDEWNNRVNRALEALRNSEWNDDDKNALDALGINYDEWFKTGADEPVTLTDGSTMTRAEFNALEDKLNAEKATAKQKAALEKIALLRANQYTNFKFYQFNLTGTPLTSESSLNIVNKLNSGQDLDGNDISGLNWAFKQAIKSGGLQNLSKEELSKFGSRYAGTPNRLKKLPGLEGVYYDSVANRLIRPYKLSEQPVGGTTLSSLISLNSPEALAKKQQELLLLAANRKLDKGWETEDYLRMGAMAQDITGAIAAWLPGYGTAASGALGLTSLGTNLAADIADESLTKWDVAKNAGMNLMLAGVGMVPGLGLASKTGKWVTNIAKWAPRLLTLQAIKDLPESYNSLLKALNKPNELTNTDWRNIAYGLSVVAGLSRGAAGVANHRRYKPAFSEGTEKQYTVTTSKGKKTITKEQVDKIKKLDPKDKEKYTEEIKKTLKLADDETFDIKDIKAFGKTLKSKGIEIKEENVPVGLSPKAKAYREYLENRNNSIKNGEGIYKYAPRFLPTNYDIYKGAATLQIPGFNISDRLRNIWNPLSDKNLLKKGIKVEETPKATETKSAETSKIDRLRMNELKEKFGRSKTESSNPKLEYNLKQLHRADVEIELFIKSYGENGKSSNNSFSHGYGSNKNKVKNGEITIELGDGIKFSYKVNNASEYKNNPGKVATLRGDVARKIQELLSSTKKVDRVKIGKVLQDLKRKGWLKQGGTINNLDTVIQDFFKNNNI